MRPTERMPEQTRRMTTRPHHTPPRAPARPSPPGSRIVAPSSTVVRDARADRLSLRLQPFTERRLHPRQQAVLGDLAAQLVTHVESVDDPTVEGRHLREVDAQMEIRERPRDVVQETD